MTGSPMSRRAFLGGAASLLVLPFAPHHVLERCGERAARPSPGPHPTPRPGIDASRIPAASALGDDESVRAAFDAVRRIPQIADGIRCHCGCADRLYSLLSCYEGEHAMARHCVVCQGHGRLAFRLHQSGKTLDEIRAAIDDRYG
jgi:hypothetical protein